MNPENLIHKYFENSLSQEERILFEKLLESDPEFKQEFEFQKQVKNAVTLNEREKLREKLVQIEQNNAPRKIKFLWYAAACAVFFFGFYVFFFNQNVSPDQLYKEYYDAYPNVEHPIVRSEIPENNLKNQAFIAYDHQEFEKSSVLFDSIYAETQEEYALFYRAISLQSLNRTEEAVKIWESNTWNEKFKDKINWYLALAKLKQNELETAKKLLQENLKSNQFKIQETKELLEELD